MIFDGLKVGSLIKDYQAGDFSKLEQIMEESLPLVEAIVSTFGFTYKSHRSNGMVRDMEVQSGFDGDDVIQECLLKISRACQLYDPSVANPHKYFTSVIRNCCINHLNKISIEENREPLPPYPITEELHPFQNVMGVRAQVVDDAFQEVVRIVKMRNRKRFPSLDVEQIDEMTEMIIFDHVYGDKTTVRKLSDQYGKIATIICNSTLIFLRWHMYTKNLVVLSAVDEFSIVPDLVEFLGSGAATRFALLFQGLTIKVP